MFIAFCFDFLCITYAKRLESSWTTIELNSYLGMSSCLSIKINSSPIHVGLNIQLFARLVEGYIDCGQRYDIMAAERLFRKYEYI